MLFFARADIITVYRSLIQNYGKIVGYRPLNILIEPKCLLNIQLSKITFCLLLTSRICLYNGKIEVQTTTWLAGDSCCAFDSLHTVHVNECVRWFEQWSGRPPVTGCSGEEQEQMYSVHRGLMEGGGSFQPAAQSFNMVHQVCCR